MTLKLQFVRLFSLLLAFSCVLPVASAADGESYTLRYKLRKGEQVVSRVSHFADTETSMSGVTEGSTSRTTSEKVWEVTDVTDDGSMTFVYSINYVNLAQSVGEGEELKYNSLIDLEAPDIFKKVAETINKPLATITINSRGQVQQRDKELKNLQGVGELTLPLPEEPVVVGKSWSVPRELRVKLDNGTFKKIKVRELYTLEKVVAGLATIRIVSQPLTPLADAAAEAQLVQQLSKGVIKFDIESGRLVKKELNWKEEVIGFRGPDTKLRYDAKFTEELVPEAKRTARSK